MLLDPQSHLSLSITWEKGKVTAVDGWGKGDAEKLCHELKLAQLVNESVKTSNPDSSPAFVSCAFICAFITLFHWFLESYVLRRYGMRWGPLVTWVFKHVSPPLSRLHFTLASPSTMPKQEQQAGPKRDISCHWFKRGWSCKFNFRTLFCHVSTS